MHPTTSRQRSNLLCLLVLAITLGCSSTSSVSHSNFIPRIGTPLAPASVTTLPVQTSPLDCTNGFISHTLDHITTPSSTEVHQFESNGAGVAINDLNNDGWLDIVLANLKGPSSIFWNRGNFQFDKQELLEQYTRAVNIVDVDGDGWQDITFTHIYTGPSYWHNTASLNASGWSSFEHSSLRGVTELAHSLAWGDLNHDNTLDLITGSYDAELEQQPGGAFLFSDGAGVYYYPQESDKFTAIRLSKESQALAIALFDVNLDGKTDILVGNDFDAPDQIWVSTESGWQNASPFARTSQHTMSYDWGDIDNNGNFEFFAPDMNPYQVDIDELAQWIPMMREMPHHLSNTDVQRVQNVLQVLDSNGHFQDQAAMRGVIASGFSWSGKFGDLNNDGYLDLYIVNGMIDMEIFDYLPGAELVEANQAFVNLQGGNFAPAPDWKLDSLASGRGMSIADLNNDGQLDIVVNNLGSPSVLFENQICEGASLHVDLHWPNSKNTRAIGAQLLLHTNSGTLTRDIRSGSGYLSGDAARIHFGFAKNTTLDWLEIRWPDGQVTRIDKLTANSFITIER